MLDELSWPAFHFLRPAWLLALLPFLLLGYLQWLRQDRLGRFRQRLPAHLLEALTLGERGWASHLPLKVMGILVGLGVLVAAGPTWQREPSPFGEDRAPLLILLDVSPSMLEADVQPSRLERAKQKILDLLALRGGARTGLVVFAGSAHLAMPLTDDQHLFPPLLQALEPDLMPIPGKFPEKALPLVERLLADESAPGSVLLLSDGVGGASEAAFARFIRDPSRQLLILAVGQEAGGTSHLPTDWRGLAGLAEASGGQWRPLSLDDSDIRWVQRMVERHLLLSEQNAMPWRDMGYPLLFPLAALALLWFRKGWTVQWVLLLVVLLFPTQKALADEWRFADLWLTPDQQGQWYFERGEYLEAGRRFRDPLWKGVAFYYGGDYPAAHGYFLRVDSPQALFNAANALARQREYLAARDLYDHLLERHPDFPHARENRALLQALIDEIEQFSASQKDEGEASRELGDTPQTAEGVEKRVLRELLQDEHYSAEQLLLDAELNALWMRRVQADPKAFLRNKFALEVSEARP